MHEYHCSVCQCSLGTRTEWLNHLLQNYHQTKARKDICSWTQSERECVLVAYASFPFASLEVLQFFSNGVTNIVTDFVWFTNRPEIAFLQFESKHKVEELLESFGGHEIRVNNQLVHVKRAGEFLGLEWKVYLPDADGVLKGKANMHSNQERCYQPDLALNADKTGAKGMKGEEVLSTSELVSASLRDEFSAICDLVNIRDDAWITVVNIGSSIKAIFKADYPNIRLSPCRNWYLGIRNALINELFICVDLAGVCSSKRVQCRHIPLEPEEFDRMLLNDKGQQFKLCDDEEEDTKRKLYIDKVSGFQFTLLLGELYILESQTGALLEYLLTFDERAMPLLSLIHFWAAANRVLLDPTALEWLLVFYLGWTKLIPTPKEILTLERGTKSLILIEGTPVDVGFKSGHRFLKQWKITHNKSIPETETDAFVLSVLQLARDFLKFCTSNNLQGCALNTLDTRIIRDAKIKVEDEVLEARGTVSSSVKERKQLKKRLARGEMLLLQPFVPKFSFSISGEEFSKSSIIMEQTLVKLNKFLGDLKETKNRVGMLKSLFESAQ